LQETGLPARQLEPEITESLLINDTEEVHGKLSRLRQLGVKIAMDDFGTSIRA
jgi:EAL domain-containing protein (putative c-di-GMP-specific phosphodiesterase class I)